MRILLATDGSEYSESAARFLTRINWSRDDTISVFHAIYAIPFRYDEKFYFNQLQAIKKEIAPRILDAAVAILKPVQAGISVEIEEGPPNQCAPEQCIIDVAEKSGSDLIVMGARGLKGIGSVFIGSVTRMVAIHSSKPVLVVKPAVHSRSDKLKILFATDGSDYSHATEELLSSIPFHGNTEVTIVNIISSGFSDIPERFVLEVNERIKEVVAGTRAVEFTESEKIIEQARKNLSKRFKNIHILSKAGDPSTEILKTGDEMEADIIAVGSRGLRGIKGIMGSVARNILTHAKSSVLIGKTCQA
jgi:nucleotide-binding universal stress UspA family protein